MPWFIYEKSLILSKINLINHLKDIQIALDRKRDLLNELNGD